MKVRNQKWRWKWKWKRKRWGLLLLLLLLALIASAALLLLPLSLLTSETSSSDVDVVDSADDDDDGLPRLAYMISSSSDGDGDGDDDGDGELERVKRVLEAVYHPRNYYLLLMRTTSASHQLAAYASANALSNVFLAGSGSGSGSGSLDLLTPAGPTILASTLHSVSMLLLLRTPAPWHWFINLSASDYPLLSQDDLLHILSFLPRDLNFLDHTSNLGSKDNTRARPIVIDSGLYHSKKSALFWAKERRSMPASFKLFMGN